MELLGSVLFALFTLMLRRRPGVALRDEADLDEADPPSLRACDAHDDDRPFDALLPAALGSGAFTYHRCNMSAVPHD